MLHPGICCPATCGSCRSLSSQSTLVRCSSLSSAWHRIRLLACRFVTCGRSAEEGESALHGSKLKCPRLRLLGGIPPAWLSNAMRPRTQFLVLLGIISLGFSCSLTPILYPSRSARWSQGGFAEQGRHGEHMGTMMVINVSYVSGLNGC